MSIPRIADYSIPSRDEISPNRVSWTPKAAQAALLVHDLQLYFLRPFTASGNPLAGVMSNIGRLIHVCRRLDIPIIYSAQAGGQSLTQRGLLADFWGPGMRGDPQDTDIMMGFQPKVGDIRLRKERYSAFRETQLATELAVRNRSQLLICGIYAHIGIVATALDAFMSDIESFILLDATADFNAEKHRKAADYAASCCAAVWPTQEVLEALGRPGQAANQHLVEGAL